MIALCVKGSHFLAASSLNSRLFLKNGCLCPSSPFSFFYNQPLPTANNNGGSFFFFFFALHSLFVHNSNGKKVQKNSFLSIISDKKVQKSRFFECLAAPLCESEL
jgi:hypothetical protein